MHSRNLNVNSSQLELHKLSDDGNVKESSVFVENTDFDLEHEFFILYTMAKLTKGSKYELVIPFDAELDQGLLGYYRSSYLDKTSQKRV